MHAFQFKRHARGLAILLAIGLGACGAGEPQKSHGDRVTLLFTNDLESAYDPVEAWWREDLEQIGGVAYLASLVADYRARSENVFLFDAGDIFTGSLASATRGAISFELLMTMNYDAMVIGNHEFEYGWRELAHQKDRVPFPVLGTNLYYANGGAPFAQRYAIVERGGVRIGVLGVMGEDAATALIPTNIAGVDVRSPASEIQPLVQELREQVDLIVVLTHQGETAPMQTNDEALTTRDRGNEANLALAAEVAGIDVILAGHTDAGTPEALVDPVNGTLIMQTYGQGQHLGVLELERQADKWLVRRSALDAIDPSTLAPHPIIAQKLAEFRAAHADLYEVVGTLDRPAVRDYYGESTLGNLLADALLDVSGAAIALIPSGALRKDLPAGDVKLVDWQDTFPFDDRIASVTLSGTVLRTVIEQGLSLERGFLQVAGLSVAFDPAAPAHQRVRQIWVNDEPLDLDRRYRVATLEILAAAGDQYVQFREADDIRLHDERFIDALIAFQTEKVALEVPSLGRFVTEN